MAATRARTLTHYRTCNLCEAMCGVAVEVEGSRILSIRGDKEDPFSRGHICPKAAALEDVQTDEDRLRHPLRRTAAGWERVSWDEAYGEISQKLLMKLHPPIDDELANLASEPGSEPGKVQLAVRRGELNRRVGQSRQVHRGATISPHTIRICPL